MTPDEVRDKYVEQCEGEVRIRTRPTETAVGRSLPVASDGYGISWTASLVIVLTAIIADATQVQQERIKELEAAMRGFAPGMAGLADEPDIYEDN